MNSSAEKSDDVLAASRSASQSGGELASLRPASILRHSGHSSQGRPSQRPRPVLVVTEGKNDVEFLRRISRMLHATGTQLPDLADMEQTGRLVFVPCGGGDLVDWSRRMAPLGCREVYLFDRDGRSEVEVIQQTTAIIRHRPECRAMATSKRSMENYLHPHAIREARGVEVAFSDEDDVADVVARACYQQTPHSLPWEQLSLRAQKRHRNHMKNWLNTRAVDRMTPERLAERDPLGEVRLWLANIAELVRG